MFQAQTEKGTDYLGRISGRTISFIYYWPKPSHKAMPSQNEVLVK